MEFIISKNEITRRKKAFVTLLTSMMVGLFISLLILSYEISTYGYLSVFVVLLFLIAITFNFFNSISKSKIFISEEEIKKTNKEKTETFYYLKLRVLRLKGEPME
jgi:dipeptide/tripeptide permease